MTEDELVEKLKEMLPWARRTGRRPPPPCVLFDEDIRRWNDDGVKALVEKAGSVLKTHVYYGPSLAKRVSPNYDVLRKFRGPRSPRGCRRAVTRARWTRSRPR